MCKRDRIRFVAIGLMVLFIPLGMVYGAAAEEWLQRWAYAFVFGK